MARGLSRRAEPSDNEAMRRSLALWTGITLAAGSLALWLASLWVISYRPNTAWGSPTFALCNGELWVTTGGTYFPPDLAAMHAWPRAETFTRLRWWPEDAWFGSYTISGALNWWNLRVPLWAPFAAGVLLAACGHPAWRRRRLTREGKCPRCAYDVRGLKDVCPECGGPISPPPSPSPR